MGQLSLEPSEFIFPPLPQPPSTRRKRRRTAPAVVRCVPTEQGAEFPPKLECPESFQMLQRELFPSFAKSGQDRDLPGEDGLAIDPGESSACATGPQAPELADPSASDVLLATDRDVFEHDCEPAQAAVHKKIRLFVLGQRWEVLLELVPHQYKSGTFAMATLSARNARGEEIARQRVPASFRLETTSITAWIENGCPLEESEEY